MKPRTATRLMMGGSTKLTLFTKLALMLLVMQGRALTNGIIWALMCFHTAVAGARRRPSTTSVSRDDAPEPAVAAP